MGEISISLEFYLQTKGAWIATAVGHVGQREEDYRLCDFGKSSEGWPGLPSVGGRRRRMRVGRRLLGGEEASGGGADGWAKVEMRRDYARRQGLRRRGKSSGRPRNERVGSTWERLNLLHPQPQTLPLLSSPCP